MKTCDTCGRPYSHPPDWSGCSTDDGLCGECREALAEWEWALKQEDAEMKRGQACDYCSTPAGGIILVDPLAGYRGWVLWTVTGKMSCPDCYSRAKRDSETVVQGMCDARIA